METCSEDRIMCGILGAYGNNLNFSQEKIIQSLNSLSHRGPDDMNYWISLNKKIMLGHTRLQVMGSESSSQPLYSSNKSIVAVVNGEFYEFEKIRSALLEDGYQIQTDSDSEILIALYQKYGISCLEYLRGEFSFLLWDENKNQLFVARDRFGIKPLYFTIINEQYYFASEAKALFCLGVIPKWNEDVVYKNNHLFLISAEESFFKNIEQVKPGHFLVVNQYGLEQKLYWDSSFSDQETDINPENEQTVIDITTSLLKDSIGIRLRSDANVACYLSGGIDSSAIYGMANEISNSPLSAFTISFGDLDYDEADIAKRTVNHFGGNIDILSIGESDIADSLSDAIYHSEVTMFNSHGAAKYLLSKRVRDMGFKVVLTGEGADESFGGYLFFVKDVLNNVNSNQKTEEYLSLLNQENKVYGSMFNKCINDNLNQVKNLLGYIPSYMEFAHVFSEKFIPLCDGKYISRFKEKDIFCEFIDKNLNDSLKSARSNLHKTMYLWLKSHFPAYILNVVGDRMEMSHSIEGRVPFLDHKFVEYIQSLPATIKVKGNNEKYLLKECVRKFVTDEVYSRQKQPFVAPPYDLSRTSKLGQLVYDTFHSTDFNSIPFFEQAAVINFLEQTQTQSYDEKKDSEKIIFNILSLCLLRENFNISM